MKLSKELLLELQEILEKNYNLELGDKELRSFAGQLVGYFDLLLKLDSGIDRFENHQPRLLAKQ